MSNKLKQKLTTLNPKQLTAGLFVIAFALAGAYLILQSHAAPYAVATEAESGTLGGNASTVNDSLASGARAVVFGSASTGGGGGGSSSSSGGKSGGGTVGGGGTGGSSGSGGCTYNGTVAPCIGSATTGASGWGTPTFDDEFSGSSLNSKYWNNTWFSGNAMNNVSTTASNVAVSGGDLKLTLSSSTVGSLVDTDPSQVSPGYQFGTGYYIEARIYFPGTGSNNYNWPAFWTDGQTWPQDGEADIAEGLGDMTSNYWYGSSEPGIADNSGPIPGNWVNGWHTYALDREANTNYIYWDGKLVRSYTTHDSGALQYLIFNVGYGGSPGDGPLATGAASQVKVDYVRVWKK